MKNKSFIDLQSNKYYNLGNNYIFKEVFSNKLLLIYLLKACFNVSLDTFEFRNVELNKNNKYRYSPIVDFKIETSDSIYLVEMQNRNLYNMSERALFSFSRHCQNSLKLNKEESIIREYIKRFNMDSRVLLEIERRENIMYLEEIGLYNAREEGKKEGLEQGNITGKKEATKEIILNLLKHNMSLEDISKVTNYSIEEIKKIEKDRK